MSSAMMMIAAHQRGALVVLSQRATTTVFERRGDSLVDAPNVRLFHIALDLVRYVEYSIILCADPNLLENIISHLIA